MSLIHNFVLSFFIISGLALMLSSALLANRMGGETCNCLKSCLIVLLIAAPLQLVFGLTGMMTLIEMVLSGLISISMAAWLLLDQRGQCKGGGYGA